MRRLQIFKSHLSAFLKYGLIGSTVRIEASSLCQLHCPQCPRAKGELRTVGEGYLKSIDFKNFVNNHPVFKKIELSNWGEIFLNPQLKDIMSYARSKKIDLTATNGVNLNALDDETLECLVKYQFKTLTVSLDGASDDIYKIYRRGGCFDTVIDNIKRINEYKRKYKTVFPELVWQFVIFGHNEHQLSEARKKAEELKMEFRPKLNWASSYSPVRNKELVRKEMGFFSRKDYAQQTNKLYLPACVQLWRAPQINWDGRLLGCVYNRFTDFGDVFEKGLKECLKSEKYVYTKRMLLGKEKPRADIPCLQCPQYKTLRSLEVPVRPFEGVAPFRRLVCILKKGR